MNLNLNFENGVWLDRMAAPAKRPHKKCGHCRQEGHTQPDCPEVERVSEQLYTECLGHLQGDLHGYLFERFVFSLLASNLKILYKRVCGKTMKKKEASVYEEIFNHFAALKIGYIGKRYRSQFLYATAFQGVRNDVARNRHGYHFQKLLLQLNAFQLKELLEMVNRVNGGNWIGKNTEERERLSFGEYRRFHRLMTPDHFILHCHFAEMDIGYNFSIHDYCTHLPQNNKPFNEAFISNSNSEILMTRKVQGNTVYMKSITLERVPVEDKPEMDCDVCYESHTVRKFVKTSCNHDFCGPCFGTIIGKNLELSKDTLCPMCRSSVNRLSYCDEEILEKVREKIVA